jgi:hypothetical protein
MFYNIEQCWKILNNVGEHFWRIFENTGKYRRMPKNTGEYCKGKGE